MKMFNKTLLALALLVAISQPAIARQSDHDRSYERREQPAIHWTENYSNRSDDRRSTRFDPRDRERIKMYIQSSHQKWCPPGLMKKGRHCTPPGHSKKYQIGDRIPSDYEPLPPYLAYRLTPAPRGTFYAKVDSDVVLVTAATHKILDAITLLSSLD